MTKKEQPQVKPKTISYSRTKKVNPGIISKQFDYMSEEVSFGLWSDIPEDADEAQAIHDLKELVEAEIKEETSRLIEHYRSIARAKTFNTLAISQAFEELMGTQGMDKDQIEMGYSKLILLAEKYQSLQTV